MWNVIHHLDQVRVSSTPSCKLDHDTHI
jgi:hypothetical protein